MSRGRDGYGFCFRYFHEKESHPKSTYKGGTVKTPGEADSGLDIDGSATDGATTGDQFQINTNGAVTTQGADLPEGGETTGVVENGETPKNGQGVGGVYIPARK